MDLLVYSDSVEEGDYLFSVYAWKYVGVQTYTRLITICDNDVIARELPDLLENAETNPEKKSFDFDWSSLEEQHVKQWQDARTKHRRDALAILNYKLESLGNSQRNRVRTLERQIEDALDESIKRMHMSILEAAQDSYERKTKELAAKAEQADIFTTLLINGRITVRRE